MDIAVADFNGDDVLDIVTAEKGAPNFLYLGLGKTDPTKLGDFSGVAPIPNSNKDGTGVFESREYRTNLGEPYDTGPSAVGIDKTVDTTGLATAVDLNGDGYPDVVTGTKVYLSPRRTLTSHPFLNLSSNPALSLRLSPSSRSQPLPQP